MTEPALEDSFKQLEIHPGEPSEVIMKKRYMRGLHEEYPGLDYLMIECIVDHCMKHPDDGPDEILKSAPKDYFMNGNTTEVKVKRDDTLFPDQQQQQQEDVEHESDTVQSSVRPSIGGSSRQSSTGNEQSEPLRVHPVSPNTD